MVRNQQRSKRLGIGRQPNVVLQKVGLQRSLVQVVTHAHCATHTRRNVAEDDVRRQRDDGKIGMGHVVLQFLQ
jgi:hypothetical protein